MWREPDPIQQSPMFLASGVEDKFLMDKGVAEGWFWNDSRTLHLLCTLFLLLLHQLHLQSSGIRFWRLGSPAYGEENTPNWVKGTLFRRRTTGVPRSGPYQREIPKPWLRLIMERDREQECKGPHSAKPNKLSGPTGKCWLEWEIQPEGQGLNKHKLRGGSERMQHFVSFWVLNTRGGHG